MTKTKKTARGGILVLTSMVIIGLLAGISACGGGDESAGESNGAAQAGDWADGFYMAQEDSFSEKTGWKYIVLLEVQDGKIQDAVWNGAHKTAGPDKVTQSKSGDYGMEEKGGAQAAWYEQAAKAEEFLLEKQDPAAITYTDDAGHTDAISGVSIHVVEFFDLAQKALKQGPVGRGPYKDGAYHAEADEFSKGWKATADLTVIGGYIAAAEWNALSEESDTTKKEASESGEYGMVENSDAQASWAEQAERTEEYLLEVQDPAQVPLDDGGATDAISGVSIGVEEFFTLAGEALEKR